MTRAAFILVLQPFAYTHMAIAAPPAVSISVTLKHTLLHIYLYVWKN